MKTRLYNFLVVLCILSLNACAADKQVFQFGKASSIAEIETKTNTVMIVVPTNGTPVNIDLKDFRRWMTNGLAPTTLVTSTSNSLWANTFAFMGSTNVVTPLGMLTNNDTRAVTFESTLTLGLGSSQNLITPSAGLLSFANSIQALGEFIQGRSIIGTNFVGNGESLTNLHGSNSISAGTIDTNKMDATAYAAFVGGGDVTQSGLAAGSYPISDTPITGGKFLPTTNGVAWGLSVSNPVVKWATNITAGYNYSHQYPNYKAIIIGTNGAGGLGENPWAQGSIAVPNDFILYDRVGNYIWMWPSHSGQNTFGIPTDPMMRIQGGRDLTISGGLNGGTQFGNSGNKWNQNFYLQYNGDTNSAQLQFRVYDSTELVSGHAAIIGSRGTGLTTGHANLGFYSKAPTWNTYPTGGFSDNGSKVMNMSPNGLDVYGTVSNNILTAYTKVIAGTTAYTPTYAGFDNNWGTYEATILGGDFSAAGRTSGQNKYSGIVMCAVTHANPTPQISQYLNVGSTFTIHYGGNTGGGGRAAAFQHSFWTHTDSTSVSSGTEQLRITSANGVSILTKLSTSGTVTAGGTTGTQTINKPSGTINFAAADTTKTVICDKVTATSIVFAVVQTADATATIKNVVPAAGSFVINLGAAATAETKVGFLVVNPI